MKSLVRRLFPKELAWFHARKKFWSDYFENGERELKELKYYVARSDLVIDIGGNIGVYTYHLSRLAREVVTFEPQPKYFQMLKALGLKRVSLENVALSSSSGLAKLRIPAVDGRPVGGMASLEASVVAEEGAYDSYEVPIRSLDSYAFENVGFIKIDVEGHEEEVIRGAQATIDRNRPNLLIEIEERHNPGGIDRVSNFLSRKGYKGYFFDSKKRHPLSQFDPITHQNPDIDTIRFTSRRKLMYINNFLFIYTPEG